MSERWMPKHGELYYYISTTRTVIPEKFNKYDAGIIARCFFGNCFRTAVEAESAAKKFKAFLLSFYEDQPVTNSNQLPKLTAEVFNRPDCPEWARYAAVNADGLVRVFLNKPSHQYRMYWYDPDSWWERGLHSVKYDASDWQHSLIERPGKETKLPDWCKPGEWVYLSNEEYDKIESIDGFGINLASGTIINKKYIHEDAVSARLRPYNAEEMKALMGKVLERKDGDAFLVTSYTPQLEKDLCAVDIDNMWVTPDDVLKDFTIDNALCGVLEHLENGEWVK